MISIHALREEGDVSSWAKDAVDFVFLSTPSARRATLAYRRPPEGEEISIHALREEGDQLIPVSVGHVQISIHALREEGDSKLADKIGIIIS